MADASDPEEAYILERLRHVYLLTDSNGYVLEHSPTYDSIGIDSPEEMPESCACQSRRSIRQDKNGVGYLIKAGSVPDEKGVLLFAIRRSLKPTSGPCAFTRTYFLLLPAMIVRGGPARLGAGRKGDSAAQFRGASGVKTITARTCRCGFRRGAPTTSSIT